MGVDAVAHKAALKGNGHGCMLTSGLGPTDLSGSASRLGRNDDFIDAIGDEKSGRPFAWQMF
jgi:hypothetical protein